MIIQCPPRSAVANYCFFPCLLVYICSNYSRFWKSLIPFRGSCQLHHPFNNLLISVTSKTTRSIHATKTMVFLTQWYSQQTVECLDYMPSVVRSQNSWTYAHFNKTWRCVFSNTHTHTHTYTYARAHTHIYARARARTHTHIYIYIGVYTHTHTYIYIYTHTHAHTPHTYIHTTYLYIYARARARTHTHIYIYHTHTI
jgi:hypothetical protein